MTIIKLELLKAKAEFFVQLAIMEAAGIPMQQSIQTQMSSHHTELGDILANVLAELKQGKPLAAAGFSAGLFNDTDNLLIQAASESGKLEQMLKTLAEQYELRYSLTKEMLSKMLMPVCIFVLAVFIAPIPGLVAGTVDALGFVNATVVFLMKIALFCWLLLTLPAALKDGCLRGLGLAAVVDALLLTLPVIGKVCLKHQLTRFFENLGLLLHAGIPIFDALPKSVNTLSNATIKHSFKPVIVKLKNQSASLTQALKGNKFIDAESLQFVLTGEQAGTLDDSLMHYSKMARAQLNSSMGQLAEWIPKIIYAIICIDMIHSIFTSHAFAPPQIDGIDINDP